MAEYHRLRNTTDDHHDLSVERTPVTMDALVLRSINGDHDSFEALMKLMREKAESIAARMVGKDNAPDVVQNAIIKAFKSIHKLEEIGAFKGWFLQIVNRESVNLLRLKCTTEYIGDIPDKAQDYPFEAGYWDVLKAKLPLQQFTIVFLREAGQLGYKEISEVLMVPVGTVRSRLHKARKDARGILLDCYPELRMLFAGKSKVNGGGAAEPFLPRQSLSES